MSVKTVVEFALDIDRESSDDISDLPFPSASTKDTIDKLGLIYNLTLNEKDPAVKEWVRVLTKGYILNVNNEDLLKKVNSGEFKQKITYEQKEVRPKRLTLPNANGRVVSGKEAIQRAFSSVGGGTLFRVQLPHSGFSVTMRPASETELLELHRILNSDKIQLGRYTYGSIFSNVSAYTVRRLTEFAINHIGRSTLRLDGENEMDIADIISVPDIPFLLWGIGCTLYPDGVQYTRACSSNPDSCNYVSRGVLDPVNAFWFDDTNFKPWMRKMIAEDRANTYTLDDIIRYKAELVPNIKDYAVVEDSHGGKTTFYFKTPTINEYVESGHAWIEGMVDSMTSALSVDTTDDGRNKYILDRSLATYMRQYGQWVSRIELPDGSIVNDTTNIAEVLDVLSGMDKVRVGFMKEVGRFISDSVVGVVGIDRFECPSCGAPQENKDTASPLLREILPLDVTATLFLGLGERVNRILKRNH